MAAPALEDRYQFRTEWSEEDQGWGGLCDAFPLMSWLEPDRKAAEAGIGPVVAEAIEMLEADGQPPPPSGPAKDWP